MVDVEKLSDGELRTKLLEYGFPVMPITGTTRKVMMKKLKFLMENKGKTNNDGRRSLGRYSSEEESDGEVKTAKKDKNRRATMAAPIMQPPSSGSRGRKSPRINDPPEPEVSEYSPKLETRVTTTSTTTKTSKVVKSSQDDFDTGSDSESDIVKNNYSSSSNHSIDYKRGSPIKSSLPSTYTSPSRSQYSPPKSLDTSYSRNVSFSTASSPGRTTSYVPASNASDYAADRLNQIRSRLSLNSAYDKPLYSSSFTDKPLEKEKEDTPFLSNFTKRLSSLSAQKKDYDYKNDIIKEHDTNGSSSYARGQLSSFRSVRGRDRAYDYKSNQNNILKNNFVSFAVLAGAALFFIFLAIMYLGMRSDTSVVPSGYIIPACVHSDPQSKQGVNCILNGQVETAIHLLNAIRPELIKRSVANRCFDAALKSHMTEAEIVTFCKSNFALKDEHRILTDLRNLEVLSFANPEWGINVIQTEDNQGPISERDVAEDMEKVVFNHDKKVTSLVMFNPKLPWTCVVSKSFNAVFNSVLFVAVVFAALYLTNLGYKYYRHYEREQKEEIGFMVERIIDILQSNAGEEGKDDFVVINHVRDMILPVTDRKRKERTWAKAVKFINENESRVRTEVQVVQGEPFEVWRWIGSTNLSMSGVLEHDAVFGIFKNDQKLIFQGENDVLCDRVRNVAYDSDRLALRGDVFDDVDETFYIAEIYLDTVGEIILTECSCPRDVSLCSHMAALALYGCYFVTPEDLVASVDHDRSQTTDYFTSTESLNHSVTDRSFSPPESSQTSINRFVNDRSQIIEEVDSVPKSLQVVGVEDLVNSEEFRSFCGDKRKYLLDKLAVNQDEIEKIADLTIGQSENAHWLTARKHRLTASNFATILSACKRNRFPPSLFSTLAGSYNLDGIKAIQWGKQHEINGIKYLEERLGVEVKPSGFWLHSCGFLGASPDGFVGSKALVEIKCPYKYKDMSLTEGLKKDNNYIVKIDDHGVKINKNHKYYSQIQGQLYITGRSLCYLVVWTPNESIILDVDKDPEWEENIEILKHFYLNESPRNKSWQGQAFETQVGSVNSLPCSPTPCLKIRGMVEDGDRNTHMIRDAVLSKCGNDCRILHCAVDTKSSCVYLKCVEPSDAAIAYRSLHGWWYSGHLVTVKYLRLERYMQRFPDSPVNGPYLKAITTTNDWTN